MYLDKRNLVHFVIQLIAMPEQDLILLVYRVQNTRRLIQILKSQTRASEPTIHQHSGVHSLTNENISPYRPNRFFTRYQKNHHF